MSNGWVTCPAFAISLLITIGYCIACVERRKKPDPLDVVRCLTVGPQLVIGLYMMGSVFSHSLWTILQGNRYYVGVAGGFIFFFFVSNVFGIFGLDWENLKIRLGRAVPAAREPNR